MVIFKLIIVGIIVFINPILAGSLIIKEEYDAKIAYIYGVVLHWGIFEVICIIFTLLKQKFSYVLILYIIFSLIIDVIAIIKKDNIKMLKKSIQINFTLIGVLVIALILFQAIVLGVMEHEDLDDASYITASTTTIEMNSMYQYNQQTGDYVEKLDLKRALSAFPQYLAVLSKLSGIHVAIMARTIYPLWAIPFSYLIYFVWANKLLDKDKEKVNIFMLLLCMFNIFGHNSVYTTSSFTLLRIWQGKASLTAIAIPTMIYLCWTIMNKNSGRRQWLLVLAGVLMCCMTTSLGVMLSAIIVGIFSIIFSIKFKTLKIIVCGLCCCVPCILMSVMYIFGR